MRHRRDYASMTADQAQMILKDLTELEFPKMMGFSIVFALFKVRDNRQLPIVAKLMKSDLRHPLSIVLACRHWRTC